MRAEKIIPVLAEKPEELEGVTIEMKRNDIGPWLVAENHTGETLEIYDAKGQPFLRIGPEGVEGNQAAEEYYVTKLGGGVIPTRGEMVPDNVRNNPDAEADWVRVSDEPIWGWFDRRLDTESMDVAQEVPKEVRQAREPADVGEWSIPVRLGEAETEVRGTYHYMPPPKGDYLARVTSEPESSDVSVQLSHGVGGGSADALFLQNRGKDPVTILGLSGEPAIRIGPEEVQINVNSPVGRAADRRSDSNTASPGDAPSGSVEEASLETAQPEWEKVSGGSSFVWLDPRIQLPDMQSQPPDDAEAGDQEVDRWEIPMEVAGEEERLTGVTEWKLFEAAATDGSEGQRFWGMATVGAVTVVPAAVILTVLLLAGRSRPKKGKRREPPGQKKGELL
jgi:hypothetical protein